MDRVYRRTQRGAEVLSDSSRVVRAETRWVLGLIEDETHLDVIHGNMRRYSRSEIHQLLAQLEDQGLVESVEAAPEKELDFTGSLSLRALSAAHNSAR